MITIINPEFFRIQAEDPIYETKNCKSLVSIFTDPKDIDLPQYRKEPFASFTLNARDCNSKSTESEIMHAMHKAHVVKYSMYTDKEYEDTTKMYDQSNQYHTLIFDQVDDLTNMDIVVAAIPCNGILQPIMRSNNFKLYNGSLIVMKNRPFKWKGAYYDKLVYLLIDLTTIFSFYEYVFTDDESEYDYRKANLHTIGLYEDLDVIANTSHQIIYSPMYEKRTFLIPCGNREDRNGFYEFPKKSMFFLSDIPNGIKIVDGNIRVPVQED